MEQLAGDVEKLALERGPPQDYGLRECSSQENSVHNGCVEGRMRQRLLLTLLVPVPCVYAVYQPKITPTRHRRRESPFLSSCVQQRSTSRGEGRSSALQRTRLELTSPTQIQ